MRFNLIHNDCLQVDIPKVDLVLADPPYGKTACRWDSIIPLDKMWEKLIHIIKPDKAIIMIAEQPFSSMLIVSNIKMFKYEWIWHKNRASNPMMAKHRPLKIHSNILIFSKSSHLYNPQKIYVSIKDVRTNFSKVISKNDIYDGKFTSRCKKDDGTRFPKSVIKFNMEFHSKLKHPTQKPVVLMEYLIRTYTNEDDTVLDFCMGSGTTGVACVNTGRKFIGIEKDKEYFELAKKRIYGRLQYFKDLS